MKHDRLVDIRGLCCHTPIIRLAAELKSMQAGAVLLAESDKISMRSDIPAFCKQSGNTLLHHEESGGLLRFWMMKKTEAR